MTGPPPTIRPARPSDLPAVAAIYAHYVTNTAATFELDPPDQQAWSQRFRLIAEDGLPFLVAELDGEVGGYAYCTPWKPRPAYRGTVEDSVYVAPWASRRGLGTALLGALLSACSAAQVREVIAVIADTGDPGSAELHRRYSFVEAGRLTGVGFKHGRRLDTLLFQRSLR
jgi:L-amino acid N-acyltransferase YncA